MKRSIYISISIFTAIFISSFDLKARLLTPVEIYSKCYSRLSNFPVDIDSEDYKNVSEGTTSPEEACSKLLDLAQLNSVDDNRYLIDTISPQSAVAKGILQNFQQLHESWFTSFGEKSDSIYTGVWKYADYSEPALMITNIIFRDMHYKNLFTSNQAIKGIRQGPNQGQLLIMNGGNVNNRNIFAGPLVSRNLTNFNQDNFSFIESANSLVAGELIGIENQSDVLLPQFLILYDRDGEISQGQLSSLHKMTTFYFSENNFLKIIAPAATRHHHYLPITPLKKSKLLLSYHQ